MLHNKISHVTEALRNLDLAAPDAQQRLDMAVLNLGGIAEGVECLEAHFVPTTNTTKEEHHVA